MKSQTAEARPLVKVNGEVYTERQHQRNGLRGSGVVSYVSQFMTLLPGDVISTGTPAGGAWVFRRPLLRPGDVCELGIQGLGSSRQRAVPYQGSPMDGGVRAAPTARAKGERNARSGSFPERFSQNAAAHPEVGAGLTRHGGFAGRPGMRKNYWVNELPRRKARHGSIPGRIGLMPQDPSPKPPSIRLRTSTVSFASW